MESNCDELGRLYGYRELQNICPLNWRLPTILEFDNLLRALTNKENRGTVYLEENWKDINRKNALGFNFQESGYKHKRKYKSKSSMNIWLEDEKDGFHMHMYMFGKKKAKKMVLFRHEHEVKKPIIEKRKFAVRCVCEGKIKN